MHRSLYRGRWTVVGSVLLQLIVVSLPGPAVLAAQGPDRGRAPAPVLPSSTLRLPPAPGAHGTAWRRTSLGAPATAIVPPAATAPTPPMPQLADTSLLTPFTIPRYLPGATPYATATPLPATALASPTETALSGSPTATAAALPSSITAAVSGSPMATASALASSMATPSTTPTALNGSATTTAPALASVTAGVTGLLHRGGAGAAVAALRPGAHIQQETLGRTALPRGAAAPAPRPVAHMATLVTPRTALAPVALTRLHRGAGRFHLTSLGVLPISIGTVYGSVFANSAYGNGAFDVAAGATPLFTQQFQTIDFNPPSSANLGCSTSVDVTTRPMQDVIPQASGACLGQVMQGNGYQAGSGTLDAFEAVFTTTVRVQAAGQVTFNFFSDDGWIMAIGPNGANQPTRVSGPQTGPATGPFTGYPVMGAYNQITSPTANSIVVNFPAAGQYPMEVDYAECCDGQLSLTLGSNYGNPILPQSITGPTIQNTYGKGNPAVKATTCEKQTYPGSPDPVNCATGNFSAGYHDLSVPGRGRPLQADRTYNALLTNQDGPLGFGWTESYSMALSTAASGLITVTDGNGSSVTFTSTAPGVYQPLSPVLATLISTTEAGPPYTPTLTFARQSDQIKDIFTVPTALTAGRLLREVERNGYATTLAYDSNGRLTTATDPAGRALTFSYNAGGRLSTISDPLGRTVSFTYSGAGNLTTATDVGGGVTQFGYTDSTNAHLLTTITDPRNAVLTTSYDSQGRVISQNDPLSRTTTYTYTTNVDGSRTTTITDARGNVEVQQYQNNELVSLTKGYGTPQAATWRYTYDPATLGVATVTDPNNHLTTNTWDSNGNLLSSIDVLSRTTAYTYDALNDLTTATDPASQTTTYQYDSSGNLQSVARPVTQTTSGTTSITVGLHTGWNQITLPLQPSGTLQAQDFLSSLLSSSGGNIVEIALWNGSSWTTAIRSPGAPSGNFTLQYGVGYQVYTDLPVSYTLSGVAASAPTALSLTAGWTLVGLNASSGVLASAILASLTAAGAVPVAINRWNGQGHQTLTQLSPGVYAGTDYTVGRAEGYFINVTNAVTWTPPAPLALTTLGYDPLHPGDVIARSDPDGHTWRYTYDQYGNLVGAGDPRPYTTTFSYDLVGRLRSVVSPQGATAGANPLQYTTAISPNAFGDPLVVTDTLGHTTRYQYDGDRNRTSVTDARGNTTLTGYDLTNAVTSVLRPDGAVLRQGYDAAGNVLTTTNALGRTTSYGYDPLNRVITTTDPLTRTTSFGYDTAGNLQAVTDPLLHTTVYTYDAANQLTTAQRPDGALLRQGYDRGGNVITTTDALAQTTSYGYDALNRVITTTDPLARTTSYGYDMAGNRASVRDPRGFLRHSDYDPANQLVLLNQPDAAILTRAYDADGNVISTTDALVHSTTYAYDPLDRLTTVTDPYSATQRTGYDALSNVISTTDQLTHTTLYGYDVLGRQVAITDTLGQVSGHGYDAVGNTTALTDTLGRVTRYGYDLANQRTSVIRPDSVTLRSGYDVAGQVITQTDGLGRPMTTTYDALGRQVVLTDTANQPTTYAYDRNSNQQAVTDALGQTTVYTYDAANQQTSVLRADGASEGRAYDADGNVVTSTDALGHATLATYDPLGRLLSRADPLGRVTRSGYDYGGNRTTLSDAMGRVTTSGYDALNRLSSLTYSDGATPNVAYTYSPTSQRATMTDGTGTTGYTYDALDRVITTTNGAGQTLGYGYDAADNPTKLVYPGGQVVTRTFDALDRPITITDWLRKSTGFAYDANSNLLTQTYPNTTTASYGYDALNRVTGIVDKAGTTPFWTYSYTRDALGRLTSAIDPLQALTHTYGYDRLNRLTSDQAGSVISTTWTYNAAHDLIQSVDALRHITGTLTYDPADGLTHLRVVSGTLVQHDDTLTQNGVGARTVLSDSVSGTVLGYGYDQAERLITATTGVTASSYAYDGDGLRQTKTVSGAAYTATWDLSGGLPTLLQENATRYVVGPGGLPLELVAGSTAYSYSYYQDQLGSTRGLLGATGRGVASASYSPYGVTGGYDGVYQPLGFAGQYTDAESGLQYLRARYYDPATAQFLTRDPLGSLTGQPYAYAGDSPLNYSDPLGLCANGLGLCPWEAVGSTVQAGYQATAAAGSATLTTVGHAAVGLGATGAEVLRLLPTGIVAAGSFHAYEVYVLTDLSQAAYTAQHIDVAGQLIQQSVQAPFVAALACPNPTTVGTAAGTALGNLLLFALPGAAVGLAGKAAALADTAGLADTAAGSVGVGGGSGSWVDESMNFSQGGAIAQTRTGSCVSACGAMLTGGTLSEDQLLAELGEWSNPQSLARSLNARGGGWRGSYFASGSDALAAAERGPMGAVLQAPGSPAHMVVIEPTSTGVFLVRDPLPGVTYKVTPAWIEKYVAGGVWR